MFTNKLVAIMNKKIDGGTVMNALAHMSLGFGAKGAHDELHLMDYIDANEKVYPNISKMPYIILEAKNSQKLKDLCDKAQELGINFSVFTNTMAKGTWEDQLAITNQTQTVDLIFYGMVLFGPKEKVSELTKKFSLWKSPISYQSVDAEKTT